jgi:hypothetical protein
LFNVFKYNKRRRKFVAEDTSIPFIPKLPNDEQGYGGKGLAIGGMPLLA